MTWERFEHIAKFGGIDLLFLAVAFAFSIVFVAEAFAERIGLDICWYLRMT